MIFRGFDIHLEQSSHVETVTILKRVQEAAWA